MGQKVRARAQQDRGWHQDRQRALILMLSAGYYECKGGRQCHTLMEENISQNEERARKALVLEMQLKHTHTHTKMHT